MDALDVGIGVAEDGVTPDVLLMRCAQESELEAAVAWAGSVQDLLILPLRYRESAEALSASAEFLGITAKLVEFDEMRRFLEHAVSDSRSPLVARPLSDAQHTAPAHACVLAMGPGALSTALRFGALTQRPVFVADEGNLAESFTALRGARSLTIVPSDEWSVADLMQITDTKRAVGNSATVGFLYPFGEHESEVFALKAIMFSRFFRGAGRYRFLFPLESRSGSFSVDPVDVVFGNGENADGMTTLLEGKGDFLFATPHSNGVNMGLGSVVLCSREDAPRDVALPEDVMPCFTGSPCNRKRQGNELLSPASVRSAVAFLYTCQGVLLHGSAYNVRHSLAARFASSPYTAALLTTPGLSLLDRSGGPFVADLLRGGETVGSATVAFNWRHGQRYGDTDDVVALFGDPEFAIGQNGAPITPTLREQPEFVAFARATGLRWYDQESAPTTDRGVEPTWDSTYYSLDYARCMIAGTRRIRHDALITQADKVGAAVDALWPVLLSLDARLAQADMAGAPPVLAKHRRRLVGEVQDAWADYFNALVANLGGYLRLQTDQFCVSSEDEAGAPQCPYCGGPAKRVASRLPARDGVFRRLLECIRCATVSDALLPVLEAVLLIPDGIDVGGEIPIEVEFQADAQYCDRNVPIAMTAVLEPFNKDTTVDLVPKVGFTGDTRTLDSVNRVAVGSLPVPDTLTPGVYYLDAMLLVGTCPTVLRRSIVVRAGEHRTELGRDSL